MSLNRYDARRDGNEADIVDALVLAGCRVLRLDKFDLLVENTNTSKVYMLEVKTATGELTKAQHQLLEQGWPLQVVRTIDEARRACGL